MEIHEMFVTATRNKFRFPFKGMISVEDLWDLPVAQLDVVFKGLNSVKKKAVEESLMDASATKEDDELSLKIAIVRYIFAIKSEEQAQRRAEHENSMKRQKIMSLMAEKDDAEMRSKSKEELAAMLDSLK